MDFQTTLSHKTLKETSPDYNQRKLDRFDALYRGGDAFRSMIDSFLTKRPSDEKYPENYEYRKQTSHYIPRAAGLIDWIVAAVFCDAPRLVGPSPYWDALNDDADGFGRPLAQLCREALLQMLLHRRAYFCVDFPDVEAMSLGEQRERGDLDACLRVLGAAQVDDWSRLENGQLEWLRTHTIAAKRPDDNPLSPAKDCEHTWRYFTPDTIATYRCLCNTGGTPRKGDAVECVRAEQHDLGSLPVYEVVALPGQWVMERVADVAIALFNRDSGITTYLNNGAFQLLVMKLRDRGAGKNGAPKMTDFGALMLDIEESAGFETVKPYFYAALAADAASLREALYEVVQAMAINAAALPQAGRLSGAAVTEMRDPLHVLLDSLSWPVRDAMTRLARDIARLRGEDPALVRLEGFAKYDATMADAKEQFTEASDGEANDTDTGDDRADRADSDDDRDDRSERGEAAA